MVQDSITCGCMAMSVNFSHKELACKCGCGQLPNLSAVKLLEITRHIGGDKPIVLTSVMRCEAHNTSVGGASSSLHMYGFAVDVKRWGAYTGDTAEGRKAISDLFELAGWFIIDEPTWIHADLRMVYPEVLKIRKL